MPRTDPVSTGRTERNGHATPLAVTHYDTLGVRTDASPAEIRRAYLARVARLDPGAAGGRPGMAAALEQATGAVDAAWAVLGDDRARAEYDRELAAAPDSRRAHAEHVWVMERELDWPLTSVFGLTPPEPVVLPAAAVPGRPTPTDAAPARPGLAREVPVPSRDGQLSPLLSGLEAVADWLGPHPRAPRTVTVPDVCGLPAADAFDAVALADLRIAFVRLTEDSAGGHGVVVDQDPAAGSAVPRHSTLSVYVVYPAGPPFGMRS